MTNISLTDIISSGCRAVGMGKMNGQEMHIRFELIAVRIGYLVLHFSDYIFLSSSAVKCFNNNNVLIKCNAMRSGLRIVFKVLKNNRVVFWKRRVGFNKAFCTFLEI